MNRLNPLGESKDVEGCEYALSSYDKPNIFCKTLGIVKTIYMGCNNFHVDRVYSPSYSFQMVVGLQHGSAIEIPFNDMTAWLEQHIARNFIINRPQ